MRPLQRTLKYIRFASDLPVPYKGGIQYTNTLLLCAMSLVLFVVFAVFMVFAKMEIPHTGEFFYEANQSSALFEITAHIQGLLGTILG